MLSVKLVDSLFWIVKFVIASCCFCKWMGFLKSVGVMTVIVSFYLSGVIIITVKKMDLHLNVAFNVMGFVKNLESNVY